MVELVIKMSIFNKISDALIVDNGRKGEDSFSNCAALRAASHTAAQGETMFKKVSSRCDGTISDPPSPHSFLNGEMSWVCEGALSGVVGVSSGRRLAGGGRKIKND